MSADFPFFARTRPSSSRIRQVSPCPAGNSTRYTSCAWPAGCSASTSRRSPRLTGCRGVAAREQLLRDENLRCHGFLVIRTEHSATHLVRLAEPGHGLRVVAIGSGAKRDSAVVADRERVLAMISTDPLATQPHFESPQFRQVMQPSIITTAAVLHFAHSWAPSGKCDFENASVCFVRSSNSAFFSAISFFA